MKVYVDTATCTCTHHMSVRQQVCGKHAGVGPYHGVSTLQRKELFFFNKGFYLFIYFFREEKGGRKEGRETSMCGFLLGGNPGTCPNWESNLQPFGSQATAQSTEPHQPGPKAGTLDTGTEGAGEQEVMVVMKGQGVRNRRNCPVSGLQSQTRGCMRQSPTHTQTCASTSEAGEPRTWSVGRISATTLAVIPCHSLTSSRRVKQRAESTPALYYSS